MKRNKKVYRKAQPLMLNNIKIDKGFWWDRFNTNLDVTIPYQYEQCRKTGRIDVFRLDWKPGKKNKPHPFWDSDVAKWLEAVSYSLMSRKDAKLEKLADKVIELIGSAQGEDGYLNTYFTLVEPEKRWKSLRGSHELYCAGTLIESATAYYQATGKDVFLKIVCRYADYIAEIFGTDKGKLKGYCGHPEIELALMKLYRITFNKKYLNLAKYFVDQRGKSPNWFDVEKQNITESTGTLGDMHYKSDYTYNQSHLPVRRQKTAEGHAVRACYLYSAMADMAAETDDIQLLTTCRNIWNNITSAKLYITGGIGSTEYSERFTFDGDLPNETAYSETCAAIALIFFAQRMFELDRDSKYINVLERTLYNTVCGSVSLDGKHFFYANPLEEYPKSRQYRAVYEGQKWSRSIRQPWFECACCPPNIARFLAALGNYIYSFNEKIIYVNLYISSTANFILASSSLTLQQITRYPFNEKILFKIQAAEPVKCIIAFRFPDWCSKVILKINSKPVKVKNITTKGYIKVHKTWNNNDKIEISFEMPAQKVYSNSIVRQNAGRFAIQRGPLVYCIEGIDNGKCLNDICAVADTKFSITRKQLLNQKIPVISFKAQRRICGDKNLYSTAKVKSRLTTIKAIPYYLRANRGQSEMLVWVRE